MFEITAEMFAEYAARGAALLDERRSGWAFNVDIDELNLANCEACVLGQVYHYYSAGLTKIGLSYADSALYGFNIDDPYFDASQGGDDYAAFAYSALTQAWITEISRRVSKLQGGAKKEE